jgi:transposase
MCGEDKLNSREAKNIVLFDYHNSRAAQGKNKTGKADVVLSLIGKLYGIEAHIKAKSSDEKYQTRQEKSKPNSNMADQH